MESKKTAFDNFDEFAKNYREIHNENIKITGADSDYFARYKIEIISSLNLLPHEGTILDFGCGDGVSLKYIMELMPGHKLHGIDVSSESVEQAKARRLPSTDLQVFDGQHIPYDDTSFDLVFVANVFHHIDHQLHVQVAREILRVLKPGGFLVLFEHNPYNPVTRKIVKECVFDTDAVLLPPGYTVKMLKKAGFFQSQNYFTLFFPRNKYFKWLLPLEKWLKPIPIGGQYFNLSQKRRSDHG